MSTDQGGPRDQVVVVTGTSRGIGRATALALVDAGFQVVGCARSASDVPLPFLELTCDLEVPGAAASLFAEVTARFPRIHAWINNAATLHPLGPLRDADDGEISSSIALNVTALAQTTALFSRHVADSPDGGVLINISSGLAVSPLEGEALYCAAKAFVNQLTRVAALEGRAHGLRAYAVEPGVVETSMQQALREASAWQLPGRDRFVALHQDGELRPPDEVGEALVALIAADGGRDDVVFRLS